MRGGRIGQFGGDGEHGEVGNIAGEVDRGFSRVVGGDEISGRQKSAGAVAADVVVDDSA